MWITICETETPGRTHPTNASTSGPQHVSADVGPLQKKGQRNPSDLQGTDDQMLRFCRGMRQLCAIHLTCCTEGKQKQHFLVRFEILTTSNRTSVLHNSKSQALLYFAVSFFGQRERERSWPWGLAYIQDGPILVAARLLGLWVRIPPGTWRYVYCEWCVLSGRGLCDGLITRPQKPYRLWCVWVRSWSLENRKALAHKGLLRHWIKSRKCVIPVVCMKLGKWYLVKHNCVTIGVFSAYNGHVSIIVTKYTYCDTVVFD